MSDFQLSNYWSNKRVIVTGGAGFLGFFLVEKLTARGAAEVLIPRVEQYDLVDITAIRQMYDDYLQPAASSLQTIVIHLAAPAGGGGANRCAAAHFCNHT